MELKKYLNDTRTLEQLIRILILAIIALVLGFGSFYYYDRYIHIGDQTVNERSITALETVVREDPSDPERRIALAEAYMENREFASAQEQAQQILNTYPENDRALLVMGISMIYQEKHAEAIPLLEKFSDIRSRSATANSDMGLETGLYYLGESLNKLNRSGDAVPVLEKALMINHTDADAMYQLGLAYTSTGSHEKAIEQYLNATRFVPNFSEAYQAMGISYAALNQPEGVNFARGMLLYSQKEYEGALSLLQESVKNMPTFIPAYIGLGLNYEEMGDLNSAMLTLRLALEIDPNNFTVAQALGRIENILGK